MLVSLRVYKAEAKCSRSKIYTYLSTKAKKDELLNNVLNWLSFIPQCSVIGFSRNTLLTVEDQKSLDHVQVQFYSGESGLLLEYFDLQFHVQLSGAGSATLGMCLYQQ